MEAKLAQLDQAGLGSAPSKVQDKVLKAKVQSRDVGKVVEL